MIFFFFFNSCARWMAYEHGDWATTTWRNEKADPREARQAVLGLGTRGARASTESLGLQGRSPGSEEVPELTGGTRASGPGTGTSGTCPDPVAEMWHHRGVTKVTEPVGLSLGMLLVKPALSLEIQRYKRNKNKKLNMSKTKWASSRDCFIIILLFARKTFQYASVFLPRTAPMWSQESMLTPFLETSFS